MSTQLSTVQAFYEAIAQGNYSAILGKLAPDVRWDDWADNHAQRACVPWLKRRTGRESVLEFFRLLSAFEIREFRVLSLMEGGNQVAAEVVIEAGDPCMGGHYRDEEMHLWTFDDKGQVVRFRHYTDTAKHIAAARAA